MAEIQDWKSLPREVKAQMAAEAKEVGIVQYAKDKGMPMSLIRAWVGAYIRQSTKTRRGMDSTGNTVQFQLPSLPTWSNDWEESVKLKWLNIWEELYRGMNENHAKDIS